MSATGDGTAPRGGDGSVGLLALGTHDPRGARVVPGSFRMELLQHPGAGVAGQDGAGVPLLLGRYRRTSRGPGVPPAGRSHAHSPKVGIPEPISKNCRTPVSTNPLDHPAKKGAVGVHVLPRAWMGFLQLFCMVAVDGEVVESTRAGSHQSGRHSAWSHQHHRRAQLGNSTPRSWSPSMAGASHPMSTVPSRGWASAACGQRDVLIEFRNHRVLGAAV
jgi:hypothetical protein